MNRRTDDEVVSENIVKVGARLVFGEGMRFLGFSAAAMGVIWSLATPAISDYMVSTLRKAPDFKELVSETTLKLRQPTHDDWLALNNTNREQDASIAQMTADVRSQAHDTTTLQTSLDSLSQKVNDMQGQISESRSVLFQILSAVKK